MKKNTPNLVTIAGLTVATLFFWVIFSIYQAFLEDADVVVEEAILADIDPTLDTTTLDILEQKVYVEEPELSQLVESIESSVGLSIEDNTDSEDNTEAAQPIATSSSSESAQENQVPEENFGETGSDQ